ncbi:MAG: DUF6807 family protein, partial [Bacteroidales bacterium]
MKKTICLTILILLFTYWFTGYCQKVSYDWRIDPVSVGLVKILNDKEDFLLWKLNFGPELKPFFHPVSSPNGTLLTAEAPPDHKWHLGLWFCWKYINKLNYWEFTGDPKNAVSEGRTEVKKIRIMTFRNSNAKIILHIDYHPWNQPGEIAMQETRTIRVSAPASDGSYAIGYDMVFTPLVDVTLDRTPVQTNASGVTWGGYAGLSMRFDQDLSNPRYFSATRDSVINGEGNPWVAANLTTPDNQTVQMVILDHPSNPRYPSAWYTINRPTDRFWFFSP